jgi:hypothetical protein
MGLWFMRARLPPIFTIAMAIQCAACAVPARAVHTACSVEMDAALAMVQRHDFAGAQKVLAGSATGTASDSRAGSLIELINYWGLSGNTPVGQEGWDVRAEETAKEVLQCTKRDDAARLLMALSVAARRDAQSLRFAERLLGGLKDAYPIEATFALAVVADRRGLGEVSTQLLEELEARGVVSAVSIAHLYYVGAIVGRNVVAAARWTRKAAESGDPEAQATMADMYMRGEGVERDMGEASRWLAILSENPRAEHRPVAVEPVR